MRRVSLILLVLGLSVVSGGTEARERLVMPFECDLEQGRIKLSPTEERSYAIVGNREVVGVTACRGGQTSGGCRTIMAHRFVISCGGAGLDWMRVAAAIRQAAAEPAWIDHGRLNIILPIGHASTAQAPCMQRPTYALGRLERRVAYVDDCQADGGDFHHVVLPEGFAPVDELGARLDVSVAIEGSPTTRRERTTAMFRPVSVGEGETIATRADPDDDIVAPIPGLEPYDAEIEEAGRSDAWVTVVERDYGTAAGASDSPVDGSWAWLLAAVALVTGAGWVRVRSSQASPERMRALWGGVGHWWRLLGRRAATENVINAGAAVKALLDQTEKVVADLKGSGPLREVLQSELKLVRQALRSVEAAARDGGEDGEVAATRSAAHYRALVRELERIRRIAESAVASFSSTRPAGSMPRTTSEAYDVLGVNPDVSAGVLKKIVDALRMSWHPDHARDDEDRVVREGRMRQINVAWELINGAREVA